MNNYYSPKKCVFSDCNAESKIRKILATKQIVVNIDLLLFSNNLVPIMTNIQNNVIVSA